MNAYVRTDPVSVLTRLATCEARLTALERATRRPPSPACECTRLAIALASLGRAVAANAEKTATE
jgi:hypothetical protein